MTTITTKTLLIVLVTFIVGAGAGMLFAKDGESLPEGMHRMSDGQMMHDGASGMDGMMDGMMANLRGKTGDEFDRAFLAEMIVHHEGAVAMAEAAKANAKHLELMQMADAIISAQTAEIAQMRAWMESWYGAE